jgi:ferritin-like metal-binding protein YciE
MKNQSLNDYDNDQEYNIENIEGGLEELFLRELKDMLWAEEALVDALPDMADAATDPDLADAIEDHLAQTEEHVERLEEIFELLEIEPETKKCIAMKGLIEEAKHIMNKMDEGPVRDAAIIAAAQKVEHYEIASYGTLRTYAAILGYGDIQEILEETLMEEKDADELLSEIADSINIDAAVESMDDQEREYEYEEEGR